MKKFFYLMVMASIALIAYADYSIWAECLKMPETTLLWMHGRVNGFVELGIYTLILDAFIASPIFMVGIDLKD